MREAPSIDLFVILRSVNAETLLRSVDIIEAYPFRRIRPAGLAEMGVGLPEVLNRS